MKIKTGLWLATMITASLMVIGCTSSSTPMAASNNSLNTSSEKLSQFIEGLSCQTPPAQHCPDENCPSELIIATGEIVDPRTGRKFFLDYPCDLKPGEKVTFILNLHGGGSYGGWQRHYFPIMDFKDEYRLVVATPNSPRRFWGNTDDEHLQNIVQMVNNHFGKNNIQAFWLAGHSQGGMTSRRLICTDFFTDKVDGFLSLSGGRIGPTPPIAQGFFPQPDGTGAARPRPRPRMMNNPELPSCDFSHIYATGEYEISGPVPDISPWAEKYHCDAKVTRPEIIDTKAGYVFDTSRQDPATKAWGRLPKGGKAIISVFPNCDNGRVVADVVRIDKGHTEGLEPNITEEIIKLMLSAQ
ncbi:MAG: alpha/beta hydrolase [Cellvibrionaceae bacterium]